MKKYIHCEFSYFPPSREGWKAHQDGKYGPMVLLTYYGSEKDGGCECSHCGKVLKTTVHHFTAHDENEEAWTFGPECVKQVFGAGLTKLGGGA